MSEVYPKKVSISFNVSFTTTKTGILVIEVDGRETGFNKGKTSGFFPGQSVGLLLYIGPKVILNNTFTSLGSVAFGKTVLVEQEETITFSAPDNLTSSLKYPLNSILEAKWLGNELGAVGVEEDNSLRVNTKSSFGIGVYYVKYLAEGLNGILSAPALDLKSYEIAVQVVGTFDPFMV